MDCNNLALIMRATILFWCVAFTLQATCLTTSTGGDCEKVQEAGEEIAEQIRSFDRLLQTVVMKCFKESQLIAESSLNFMKEGVKTYQSTINTAKAPIEDDTNIQNIENAMSIKLDSIFAKGYGKFFELLKKAGGMVLGGDSTVVNSLVKYPSQNRRRKRAYSIDDQIGSLRHEMNTSLSGVETHLYGVAKQLYGIFGTGLRDLVNSQEYKADFDKASVATEAYLRSAIQTAIQTYVDAFYQILKITSQQVEIIDSIVKNVKNDALKLQEALEPGKTLIAEAIQDLNKSIGLNEMKKQAKLKLEWMQNTFKSIKADLSQT